MTECAKRGGGETPLAAGPAWDGPGLADYRLLYPGTGPIMHLPRVPGILEPDPACGQVIAIKVCEDSTHTRIPVRHHCKRLGCKVCWSSARTRSADRITDRLEGFSEASGLPWVPWHVDLSPPPEVWGTESEVQVEDLIRSARKISAALGVTSAVLIVHGYRIRPGKKREAHEESIKQGLDRYRYCMNQDDPREYLYWSPHFHLMGWGFLENSKKFEERTGWVYHKERTRSWEDIPPTVSYLLSHAWLFSPGKNAYRYWGGLSPTKLAVTQDVAWEIQKCKVCGKALRRIPVDLDGVPIYQDLHTAPLAKIMVIIRRYSLRTSKGPPGGLTKPILHWYEDQDPPPDDGSIHSRT